MSEVCSCGCGAVIDRSAQAYWNGIPIAAVRGSALVADSPEFPAFWARTEGIIGQRIPVVMVNLDGANYGGGIDYLDNRDEEGWRKIAYGGGSPRYRHKSLSIEPGSFEPETTAATQEAPECACGCPADMHIGEIGCPCGLSDEPPCTPAQEAPEDGEGE